MTARQNMNPKEFRDALDALGLTPTAFAKLIGSNDKNMRRAAEDGSDGPGPAASFALRCLLAFKAIRVIREEYADDRPCYFYEDADALAADALRGQFPGAEA